MSAQPKPGRRYDAALQILDRQVVDADNRMVCKVDDLELEQLEDGRIIVTSILTGPGAWGERMPSWIGRWALSMWRRLRTGTAGEMPEPGRIPMSALRGIGSGIELSRTRADLDVEGLEAWVRERVIDKIPGAFRAPE
jgi:hypothetical protein